MNDADCDDGVFCTIDRCFFQSCSNTHNDSQCNDGVFCNGTEFCDADLDACASGTPPTCPDGQFCSTVFDNCVECEVDGDCDDGQFCNGVETCNLGLCKAGTPVDCSFLDTECITGICNESTDMCVQGAPCDDGNLCTDDICTVGVGCTNPPNYQVSTECCDPQTGNTVLIDDGDGCTDDTCNASTGVVSHRPVTCSDGNACTVDDVCTNNGAGCEGSDVNSIPCDDDADCPVGACNDLSGFCDCDSCSSPAQCDDAVACTVDDCVNGACVHAPDDAVCQTGQFCQQQNCDRNFGCVLTDFCTPQDGNPCPTAGACNETTDLCGGCPLPTVEVSSRYLSITPPDMGLAQMALFVKGDCFDGSVSCVGKYVDFDDPPDPQDPKVGRLIATPVYRTVTAWGTVHVRGLDIKPDTVYRVHTECDPGAVQSAATLAETSVYGDTNDNGTTNFVDITRTVQGFKGEFHFELTVQQTDLTGSGCLPNRVVDFADITEAVRGFKDQAYPCGAPCP